VTLASKTSVDVDGSCGHEDERLANNEDVVVSPQLSIELGLAWQFDCLQAQSSGTDGSASMLPVKSISMSPLQMRFRTHSNHVRERVTFGEERQDIADLVANVNHLLFVKSA